MLRFPDDGLPTIKAARAFVGGVSTPSKMPGLSWNISAKRCKLGSVLREQIENSVCASCYALKGRYRFRNVIDAQDIADFVTDVRTGIIDSLFDERMAVRDAKDNREVFNLERKAPKRKPKEDAAEA